MRYLGLLITILGLLESFRAAPDRVKRQVDAAQQQNCEQAFGVPCDFLTTSSSTLPPLNRDLITADGSDCQCVPYYQCHSNYTLITDGKFIIDKRLGSSPQCRGSVEVCCQPASIPVGPNITPGGTSPGGPSTGGTSPGGPSTGGTSPGGPSTGGTSPGGPSTGGTSPGGPSTGGTSPGGPITGGTLPPQTLPPPPIKPGCGHRNPGGVQLQINGVGPEKAQFGEFPWMVAVIRKPVPPKTDEIYICGGSLIHPRAVLTSAHNLEKQNVANLIVRAGEWDTKTTQEPLPYQERQVQEIIIHNNFNTDNLHNDVALMILDKGFDRASHVNVICLPRETDVFDATRCTATGWGKENFEKTSTFQTVLKKVELPVVPFEPCQIFLRLTRLGKAFILDPSFICAGGELGKDTCTGDGGSPLACPLANTENRYVQAGIVAWGISCGNDRTPGVYANVAKARKWIDSKMAQHNLDTSSYTV